MKKYKPKKMLSDSRFSKYVKTLSKNEYNFTLKNLDQLVLENREYVDDKNYGYLCNLFSCLALVWMLEKEGNTREESEKIVLDAMYDFLKPKIPAMNWISKHRWFVPMLRKTMPKKFSRTCGNGWKLSFPESEKNCFVMITHECLFAKIFKKYGMPELTFGFCKVDNLMYDKLPNTRFFYTERIGEGGNMCDYHFERMDKRKK
jgi:hypothetical protein